LNIGVLGLQGAFQKHINILKKLNVSTTKVRYSTDFKKIDALIIPGGESTTLSRLIIDQKLLNPMRNFIKNKPVFGTCAGLILLSTNIEDQDDKVISFRSLDVKIKRNGWGRQIQSFKSLIDVKWNERDNFSYNAIFIRAPKIISCNGSTEILSTIHDSPVMVRDKNILATTFHPELTDDIKIHKYFLEMINNSVKC
tara:strand:- start:2 stop:592 length:591 start_codon:yes stop_codon:yes gene_type:complete